MIKDLTMNMILKSLYNINNLIHLLFMNLVVSRLDRLEDFFFFLLMTNIQFKVCVILSFVI